MNLDNLDIAVVATELGREEITVDKDTRHERVQATASIMNRESGL